MSNNAKRRLAKEQAKALRRYRNLQAAWRRGGRIGGQSTSAAKVAASVKNGKQHKGKERANGKQ